MLDQAVVEGRRDGVAAAGRRAHGQRGALLDGLPVDEALRANVEEPAAALAAHPRPQLGVVALRRRTALLPALAAALVALAAVQAVERVVRVLVALLGVQRALDAGVELVQLLGHDVPLALLFRREGAVFLRGLVRESLHLLPDVRAATAERLDHR
jgi:hypothetical protein